MASSDISLLEHCKITPPQGTLTQNIPLTFFDLIWLKFSLRHIFFYEFRHSKDYFTQTAIPKIKDSLSLALKHYYPLAGKLILSQHSGMPEIVCSDGDYLSLIFAESSNDFNYLAGNYERAVDELDALVPEFEPSAFSPDTLVPQFMAIQVTYFPNTGISFGFKIHHTAGDASSIFNFFKSWAMIAKQSDSTKLDSNFLPFLDRTIVNDPYGLRTIYWNQLQSKNSDEPRSRPQSQPNSSPNTTRATFIMTKEAIAKLKKFVSSYFPETLHVSTYTVTCGYLWTCIVKARVASGKYDAGYESEMEQFIFSINCRELLDPPVPENYFGNCTVACIASVKNSKMVDKDGFVCAAKAIGEAIYERKNKEGGILQGEERLFSRLGTLNWKRLSTLTGSPKLGTYEIDLGWGKPKKSEILANEGTISLDVRPDGNLEVSISLPKNTMDAFASVFANGLSYLE